MITKHYFSIAFWHLEIYGFRASGVRFAASNLKGAIKLKYNFLTHPAQMYFTSQVQHLA